MRTGRRWALSLAAFAVGGALSAQELDVPEGYEVVDSVVYRPADTYDVSLSGVSVFEYVRDVDIVQARELREGMLRHIGNNSGRKISGWRVRIFFDNKQDSRAKSEEVLEAFRSRYPGCGAYRTFANPFFKVTVGDFRTKSEALELLERVRREFPSAFVVREDIAYPVVDKDGGYVMDTLKVLRRICSSKD